MSTPGDPAEAGAAQPASAVLAPRRRRVWLVLALAALPLLLVALLLTGASAAWRSLHTESGTRWWLDLLAASVPALRLDTPRGALLGADARFSLAAATWDDGATRVRIDTLRVDGLQVDRWQWRAPHLRLRARSLAAQRVDVERPAPAEPAPPPVAPQTLQWPLTAEIDALRIERLQLPGLAAPLEGLSARLAAGATHRIDALALRWNGLQASGRAQIDAAPPLRLDAQLALRSDAAAGAAPTDTLPAWARGVALALRASGPLQRFDASASLTAQAQQIDATAQLTPFETLPLAQLDARFTELDLARLLAPFTALAPTTRLTGSARLQLGSGAPLVVSAQADNALPGRWDQQRLPLRRLELLARGRGSAWQIESARLQLAGDAPGGAGEVSASGRFDAAGGAGEARLALSGVLPQSLDRRGPPLRLSGPLDLTLAPRDAAGALGRLAFDAQLDGALQGEARGRAPAPLRDAVRLAVRGSATPTDVRLDALSARAGAARLDGSARARRDGAVWATEADLKLAAFDPALWLPGEPGLAWRRAGNALNGSVTLRARVPAAAADTRALLAALSGTLRADLAASRLAGQPLALKLQADADGRGRIDARADADAADNRAQLTLRLRAPGGAAATDERLQWQLDAPALARLAPLADAFGLGPLAGRAQLEGQADGPLGAWLLGGTPGPLATRGTLQLDALQAGTLQVGTARGQWQATLPAGDGAGANAALARALLQVQLDAKQLRTPTLLLPELALQAAGTLAEHRATLSATLRQPPRASLAGATGKAEPQPTVGAPPPSPLRLDARLGGAWRGGAAGAANVWRATLQELTLRPTVAGTTTASAGTAGAASAPASAPPAAAASAPDAPNAPLPLVVARDLQLLLEQGPQSLRATLAPGRAELLGAVLVWRDARWERVGAAAPQLNLQAEIEPVLVAELLRRLQPDFGWAGDLRVGARVDLRSGAGVSARMQVARTGGDLQVSEFGVVQSLGLSDARIGLVAEGGVWRLTQRLVGANLGRVEGEQTVRSDPAALWPAADAPIDGRLSAQVDNLGAWGAWVPAGWRLGGRLDAALRVAGRYGAPELIGEVRGRQLSLRHALEGVALSEGTLDARFDGSRAQLTTLRFKAGDGELRASGDAQLGDAPQAQLRLVAERALLLGRVDRRVVASGSTELRFESKRVAVSGDLRVDEGLIDISRGDAPSLGDDVTVRRRGAADDEAAAAQAARRAPRAVELVLEIDLGPRFRLRGRGIDTRLAGALRLLTPNGRLIATGEIRTDAGTYEAYGQKLEIERGVITFVGNLDNPRLDIEAVRANTDTRVGVRVGGNVQAPRVRLFSVPELPDTDKLALLVTGRSYDSLAGADTLLLQRAALALLAGDGGDGNPFDVARLLQLDELSVRQTDGAVRDTVVTLGKQISDRVYLGYERGLNATTGNWQLIYRIAQRFTLRAQSGEDPAVDLIWIFRWN